MHYLARPLFTSYLSLPAAGARPASVSGPLVLFSLFGDRGMVFSLSLVLHLLEHFSFRQMQEPVLFVSFLFPFSLSWAIPLERSWLVGFGMNITPEVSQRARGWPMYPLHKPCAVQREAFPKAHGRQSLSDLACRTKAAPKSAILPTRVAFGPQAAPP